MNKYHDGNSADFCYDKAQRDSFQGHHRDGFASIISCAWQLWKIVLYWHIWLLPSKVYVVWNIKVVNIFHLNLLKTDHAKRSIFKYCQSRWLKYCIFYVASVENEPFEHRFEGSTIKISFQKLNEHMLRL